jgi:hypothetical protein
VHADPYHFDSSQQIKGSHNTPGKLNTLITIAAFTKPSSLGLDHYSHRLTLRDAVKFPVESKGARCRRQFATWKLATTHNAQVHMNVHHAAKAPSSTANHGLMPRSTRNVVRAVNAAQ